MAHHYDVDRAVTVLARGGLILYPTDTIWGIGCDATDAAAVASIYKLKRRDTGKSLIVLVDSIEMLRQYVAHLHPRLETLQAFHNRPLTILYDQAANLAPNITAADGSIAIRIPHDRYCRDLISALGKPLVAAAANVTNTPCPKHFGEVSSEIIQGVDYVEKYRQREKTRREPSVIVRLNKREELEFLRE
ncbi:MAG: L-threonylcarbamoyladenylate synthase [Saprospiraceae bacterium]